MQGVAVIYSDAGADKLLLADWGFVKYNKQLFGKVDVYLTEPMKEVGGHALRDWICRQNSDALGEGFEQQEIPLESEEYDGDLSQKYRGLFTARLRTLTDDLGKDL